MAVTQWGTVALISTTVEASPAPTTTVFTVTNGFGFQDTMFIETHVAGVYFRRQIDSIVGNVITLATALPGTPDVPGSVQFKGEMITNEHLNEMVDAINSGGLSWSTITTDTTLSAAAGYVTNSTSRLALTLPGTFSMGAPIVIKSKNTGGFDIIPASGDSVIYGDVLLTQRFSIVGTKYPAANLMALEDDAIWEITCPQPSGVLWFSFAKGYVAGGYDGSVNANTIDKLTFSTEAIANLAATLQSARYAPGSAASNVSDKGYWFSGSTTTSQANNVTEIDGVNMATDAAINPAATVTTARIYMFSLQDFIGDKAYIAGGVDTANNQLASIEKWTHSTEAISAVSDSLVRISNNGVTGNGGAYSSTTMGYMAGSRQASTNTSVATLAQFDFVTEATEETRNVIKSIQDGASPPADAALSNSLIGASYHNAGFLFGGNSSSAREFIIGKIPFDSGAEIHVTATLGVSRFTAGKTQSSDKAFLCGNAAPAASITSYSFVNDTQATISAVLVGNRNSSGGLP